MFTIKKGEDLSLFEIYKLHKYKKEFFDIEEGSTHIWYEENNKIIDYIEVVGAKININDLGKLKETSLEEEILKFAENRELKNNYINC